jgi:hypothetical protein
VNLEIESSILRGLVPLAVVPAIEQTPEMPPALPEATEDSLTDASSGVPLESFQDY